MINKIHIWKCPELCLVQSRFFGLQSSLVLTHYCAFGFSLGPTPQGWEHGSRSTWTSLATALNKAQPRS
jgi:hypothetical protein